MITAQIDLCSVQLYSFYCHVWELQSHSTWTAQLHWRKLKRFYCQLYIFEITERVWVIICARLDLTLGLGHKGRDEKLWCPLNGAFSFDYLSLPSSLAIVIYVSHFKDLHSHCINIIEVTMSRKENQIIAEIPELYTEILVLTYFIYNKNTPWAPIKSSVSSNSNCQTVRLWTCLSAVQTVQLDCIGWYTKL